VKALLSVYGAFNISSISLAPLSVQPPRVDKDHYLKGNICKDQRRLSFNVFLQE
jgi:hypothetical protein